MGCVTILVTLTMLTVLLEVNMTCLRGAKKLAKLYFYMCMRSCLRERLTLEINGLKRMSVLTSVRWLHPIPCGTESQEGCGG